MTQSELGLHISKGEEAQDDKSEDSNPKEKNLEQEENKEGIDVGENLGEDTVKDDGYK